MEKKLCGEGGPRKNENVWGGSAKELKYVWGSPPKICRGVPGKMKYVGGVGRKKKIYMSGGLREIFHHTPLRISNGIALILNGLSLEL